MSDDKTKNPITWRPRPVTRERLDKLVKRTGRNRSELINRAVDRYLRELETED